MTKLSKRDSFRLALAIACMVNLPSATIGKPSITTKLSSDLRTTALQGGDYRLTFSEDDKSRTTNLRLSVQDERVLGDGVDGERNDAHPFLVEGVLHKPNQITFSKQYLPKDDHPVAKKPIYFSGTYEASKKGCKLTGTWQT